MMMYGELKDKANFVFNLISIKPGEKDSINFTELVIFYFKILDEFSSYQDPHHLLEEDFKEYIYANIKEKEEFMSTLNKNLVASISLADVFFNLMRVDLNVSVCRDEFISFIENFPQAMEFLNFIDINDRDFKEAQNMNKIYLYRKNIEQILKEIKSCFKYDESKSQIQDQTHQKVSILNVDKLFLKAEKLNHKIESSFEQSLQQEKPMLKYSSSFAYHNKNNLLPTNQFKANINTVKQMFQSNFGDENIFEKEKPTNISDNTSNIKIKSVNIIEETNQMVQFKNSVPIQKKVYSNSNSILNYTKNINKTETIGQRNIYQIRLKEVYKKLCHFYQKLKEDEKKQQFNLFTESKPLRRDSFEANLKNKNNSKKAKKSLKKQLRIYDENYCIAMTFVRALQKSLLLLSNERHVKPIGRDFEMENMISVNKLNKNVYDYCEFIDIAPLVFQRIRLQDGINNEDFIQEIGYNDFRALFSKKMKSLKEEKSTGKSGSVFFESANGKYFIKTIRSSEVKVLKRTLNTYYNHLENNLDSLLSRYYGLHKLHFYKNNKLKKAFYLVIMNNLFHNGKVPISPYRIFDLKGSTYKRKTNPEKLKLKAAGKDLDFLNMIKNKEINIKISYTKMNEIVDIIQKDSEFLANSNIIDYR